MGLTQGTDQTYNTGDTINGNGNTIVSLVANGGDNAIVDMNNVASVNVNLTANSQIDGTEFTNVAQVALTSGVAGSNLTVNNAQLGTTYAINVARAENLTIDSYAAATGTSDTVNLSVSGAGLKATAGNRAGLYVAGGDAVEAVTLATSGTNYVDLDAGTGAKTITVTGAGTNDIALTSAATTYTLDASATTGTNVLNIGANVASTDVIKGGSGTDTLVVTLPGAFNYNPTVSGVETVEVAFDKANATYNASKTTGATTFTVTAQAGADALSNLAAAVQTVNIGKKDAIDSGVLTVGYASGAASDLTVNIGATSTTADPAVAVDGLTVKVNTGALNVRSVGDAENDIGNISAATVSSVTLTGATQSLVAGTIGAAKATAVTIDGTVKGVDVTGQTSATEALQTVTVTSGVGTATLGAVKVDAATAATDLAVTVTAGAEAAEIGALDVNGVTKKSVTTTQTINGGEGAVLVGATTVDSLGVGGTLDSTVTIVGGEGAITDLAGTGVDFTFTAEKDALNASVTVTGGNGAIKLGDVIFDSGDTEVATASVAIAAGKGGVRADLIQLVEDTEGSTVAVDLNATAGSITVTAIDLDVTGDAEGALGLTLTAASGKTLTITDLTDTGKGQLATLVASGAGTITVGEATFANIGGTSIDATGTTGNVTIDLQNSEGDIVALLGNAASSKKNILSTGDGADSILGGTGVDSVDAGAGIDTVEGAAGNDVYVVSANADVVAGDIFNGGTGTNSVVQTATGSLDLSVATISYATTLTLAANGGADNYAIAQGFSSGSALTVNGGAIIDGDRDTFTIDAYTTAFDNAAVASAALVLSAGEWYLDSAGAADIIYYWDESADARVAVTLVGSADGLASGATGNLVYIA